MTQNEVRDRATRLWGDMFLSSYSHHWSDVNRAEVEKHDIRLRDGTVHSFDENGHVTCGHPSCEETEQALGGYITGDARLAAEAAAEAAKAKPPSSTFQFDLEIHSVSGDSVRGIKTLFAKDALEFLRQGDHEGSALRLLIRSETSESIYEILRRAHDFQIDSRQLS